jgi:quercetin dioxygenase-like cupin family protein
MAIFRYDEIALQPVDMDGVKDTTKSNVIGPPQGWDSHTLRVFRIEPEGNTPRHQHDWEHVNHVISGRGQLMIAGETFELSEKDFAFVPPNTEHQFTNPHNEPFEFICIVPNRGAY